MKKTMKSILIPGPGPIKIGEGTELDDLCAQACRAFCEKGLKTMVISPNPSALSTDRAHADHAYIRPVTREGLREIIDSDRPDMIFPYAGGATALRLCAEPASDHRPQWIGSAPGALSRVSDRIALRRWLGENGFNSAPYRIVSKESELVNACKSLGFPVFIKDRDIDGPGSSAYNTEEVERIWTRIKNASPDPRLIVEKSLAGQTALVWSAIRDRAGDILPLGILENMDSIDIHSGDAVAVTPPQTLQKKQMDEISGVAEKLAEKLNAVGFIEVKMAYDDRTPLIFVTDVNRHFTRTASFLSRITGIAAGYAAARTALGDPLEALVDERTMHFPGVAVRLPGWDFDRFEGVPDKLDSQMSSTGAAIGLGGDFIEALSKAARAFGPEPNRFLPAADLRELPVEVLYSRLSRTSSRRLPLLFAILQQDSDINRPAGASGIKPWFLEQIRRIAAFENHLDKKRSKSPLPDDIRNAKIFGYSDSYLSLIYQLPEAEFRETRKAMGIRPGFREIPRRMADNAVPVLFSSYRENGSEAGTALNKSGSVLIGGGPNRIGQAGETDYALAHAGRQLRKTGHKAVLVQSNPHMAGMDPDNFDRLYMEPIETETILEVLDREKKSLIVQFGGNTALDITNALAEAGADIPGIPPDAVDRAMNRSRFREIVKKLAIPLPRSETVTSPEQAVALAREMGYPLLVRKVNGRNGKTRGIRAVREINDDQMLMRFISESTPENTPAPKNALIQMDAFLDNAVETEMDLITDGKSVYIPTVMEHIELAGIHSGDAAILTPPVSIAPKHMETLTIYAREIALAIRFKGLMNIQFAIFNNTIYVLEVTPGASKTVPVVSRATGVSMAGIGVDVILGKELADFPLTERQSPQNARYFVKEAVFPFKRFPEADPALGLEMKSTGSVLGCADSFGMAFYHSQLAAGMPLPLSGNVLFSISDRDKSAALEPARLFSGLGFLILATEGTSRFLNDRGINCRAIRKIGYGRPNLLDEVKNNRVQLIVNTVDNRKSTEDSGSIRKTATFYQIPYITTTAAAIAAAKGIAACSNHNHNT